ncbi:MAG TPA: murein biosynthesis integral membrane protein MurJ [Rhizomicrobium sp.]|nr:murein biosynthesis integral membrane protein MurJ [Rhizomicrobium sp.]
MFKRLLSVGGFTLLSRITGFMRDVLMAWILGKGVLSDAFIVAFLFPNYFRQIFGEGTINPAFLPRYAALRARGEFRAAEQFGDHVFSWQMAVQLAILVLGLLFMPAIIHALAPGFADNPGQLALTVSLARVTFPYLILTLVAVQLSAMLNAIEKFWAAAAWSNLLNLSMIATLLASRWFPNAAFAAAWGVLAGGVAQLFFMLWAAKRDGLSLHVSWPRWTADIKEYFVALGAVTLGAASVVVAPFVDTIIASLLPTGTRTALYYADRINQLPLGVLGIALGTVLLPEMSSRLALGDRAGSDAAQNRSASLVLLLTLPFAAVFLTIPDTIMRGIFAHGHFDRNAAALSAIALAAYGVGLPGGALIRIFASTFYARHDTMTPARVTVAAILVNIAFKVLFVWGLGLGIAGIALGTAIGQWVNAGLIAFLGSRRGLLRLDSHFWGSLLPAVVAGAVAGAAAYGAVALSRALPHPGGQIVPLFLALVLSSLAYGAVVVLFRHRLPLGRLIGARA